MTKNDIRIDENFEKISWLTNLPAPYRLPIWDKMSSRFALEVFFTQKKNNSRKWKVPEGGNWSHNFLNRCTLRLGDREYVINPFGARRVTAESSVLIIGGWENPIYFFSILYARKKGLKVIEFYESTQESHRFAGKFVRLLKYRVLNLCDFVVTAGSASTKAVLATGIKAEKIVELFNPVDVTFFHELSVRFPSQVSEGHRFLLVGQLIGRKNIPAAISAFSRIADPSDTFTIVGEGPLRGLIQEQIKSLNLESQVSMVGYQSQEDVAMLYASSQTLVMPSTNEVWGLVANEALASGMHAIVSDVSGVREFIDGMQGAYICGVTVESIASQMQKSKSEWNGRIANPEIMEYTPERFADSIVELIDNFSNQSLKRTFTWWTNIPMLYRVPVWEHLSRTFSFNLIFNSLLERGRYENVISKLAELDFKILGIRTWYFGLKLPIYFSVLRPFLWIRANKCTILYIDGWESPTYFINAYLAKRRGIKLIIGYRSTQESHRFTGKFVRLLKYRVLNLCDFVVTAGSASTKAVLATGIKAEKIVELFNPVDVTFFHELSVRFPSQVSEGHRFLLVGQLIGRKNIPAAISAFSRIADPSDTFTIVGEGPLRGLIQEQIKSLNLESQVSMVGYQSQEDVAMLYASSQTLVMPSTNEVWGLVANEALASGMHAIVSDVSGVREFIDGMQGAYICGVTVESIASQMQKSKSEWNGRIANPEIMEYTPERFADSIVEACLRI